MLDTMTPKSSTSSAIALNGGGARLYGFFQVHQILNRSKELSCARVHFPSSDRTSPQFRIQKELSGRYHYDLFTSSLRWFVRLVFRVAAGYTDKPRESSCHHLSWKEAAVDRAAGWFILPGVGESMKTMQFGIMVGASRSLGVGIRMPGGRSGNMQTQSDCPGISYCQAGICVKRLPRPAQATPIVRWAPVANPRGNAWRQAL